MNTPEALRLATPSGLVIPSTFTPVQVAWVLAIDKVVTETAAEIEAQGLTADDYRRRAEAPGNTPWATSFSLGLAEELDGGPRLAALRRMIGAAKSAGRGTEWMFLNEYSNLEAQRG